MIVEDDKIVASELYNLLTNSSYEATILTNFENALETILTDKESTVDEKNNAFEKIKLLNIEKLKTIAGM